MLSLAHEPDVACVEGAQTSCMCGRCRVRLGMHRLHSSLGYRSPAEYETALAA